MARCISTTIRWIPCFKIRIYRVSAERKCHKIYLWQEFEKAWMKPNKHFIRREYYQIVQSVITHRVAIYAVYYAINKIMEITSEYRKKWLLATPIIAVLCPLSIRIIGTSEKIQRNIRQALSSEPARWPFFQRISFPKTLLEFQVHATNRSLRYLAER